MPLPRLDSKTLPPLSVPAFASSPLHLLYETSHHVENCTLSGKNHVILEDAFHPAAGFRTASVRGGRGAGKTVLPVLAEIQGLVPSTT